jgi:hypothetical protein
MAIEIPELPGAYIVFVNGPISSGKSWLMQQWALKLERVLIQDVTLDFDSAEYEHIYSDAAMLAERLKENPYYFRIAYHVNPENVPDDFLWNFRAIWTCTELPRWFFIDECSEIMSFNNLHPAARTLLRYCRHNQLGIVCATQRIADVDKLVTSGARMVVLFYTDEVRDLDAIYQRYGREVVQHVERLRPCIYDDVKKVVEQEPQALLYVKGRGFRVIDLGSKIKQVNMEDSQWQGVTEEAQTTHDPSSSEHHSGSEDERLQEPIYDHS